VGRDKSPLYANLFSEHPCLTLIYKGELLTHATA
jgi:hypothetical protein